MTVGWRLAGTVVLALTVGACGGDSQVGVVPTVTQESPTTVPTTTTTTTSQAPATSQPEGGLECGDELPVFPSTVGGSTAAGYMGTEGIAPDSLSAEPGQLVVHWLLDHLTMEIRWPAGPIPEAALPMERHDDLVAIGQVMPYDPGYLLVAEYGLDDNRFDPCVRLAVHAMSPIADQLQDEIRAFLEGLRPVATLDDLLAAIPNRQALADCPAAPPAEPATDEVRVFVECGPLMSLPSFPTVRPVPEGSSRLEAAVLGLVRGTTPEEQSQLLSSGFDAVDPAVSGRIEVEASIDTDGVAHVDFLLDGERWSPGPLAGTSAQLISFDDPFFATVFQFDEVEALDLQELCWGERGCGFVMTRSLWQGMNFVNRLVRDDHECSLATAWTDPKCWLGSPTADPVGRAVVVNVAIDDTLNIRTGPGAGYRRIGELEPGAYVGVTPISATATDGGSWRVVHGADGYLGWVNDEFLDFIDG